MRIAALICGLSGGIIGIVAAIMALGIGGLAEAFEAEGAGLVVGGGVAALVCAVAAIVGGALALSRPGISAVLQLLAAVVGFIAIFLFWLPSLILLLIGALFALLGRRSPSPASA